MDFSWTCNPTSGVCTASADLVAWATDVLQAVWFLGGAVLGATCVLILALVLFRRLGG